MTISFTFVNLYAIYNDYLCTLVPSFGQTGMSNTGGYEIPVPVYRYRYRVGITGQPGTGTQHYELVVIYACIENILIIKLSILINNIINRIIHIITYYISRIVGIVITTIYTSITIISMIMTIIYTSAY